MANYFVDSTTGDDGDSGLTMDLAFATLDYAAGQAQSPGDIIWIRRLHSETPTSDISLGYNGTPEEPIQMIGWPRNSDSSPTGASWTNGSTTVDLVTGLSMSRLAHLGRYVTAPDGYTYMITLVTDSNTFTIDREYAGSSVTLTDGAFTIQADSDYALAQAIDDSGWTITKSDYNSDADAMPTIDFGDGNFQFTNTTRWGRTAKNFEVRDSTDNSLFLCSNCKYFYWEGMLLHQSNDKPCVNLSLGSYSFRRCILSADNPGTAAFNFNLGTCYVKIEDVASYGCQIPLYGNTIVADLDNVNLGVEVASDGPDLRIYYTGLIKGKDVKFGGAVEEVDWESRLGFSSYVSIENYNKVLGVHKTFTPQGTITKTDVVVGSGDPEKRSGGADSVIGILFDLSDSEDHFKAPTNKGWTQPIFDHEFEVDDTTKSFRYYVQAEGAVTADELYIELEYVSAYDDTSEYVNTKVVSTDSISARSGADDWSQYIEVNNITPAVASKVRIKLYCGYYHATNKIYIDPQVRVS